MAELHSCYPSSPSDKRKQLKKWLMKYKRNHTKRDHRLLLLHSLGWELSDISGRQEVHHRFIALLHGEQLRDLNLSASARFPSCCFPHRFPEHFLLVFPLAGVAEEVFPCLGRSASTAEPPAFVVVLVSELFQVHAYWYMPWLSW